MTTGDKILLAQTVGVWAAVLVAPATVWAMFAQTRSAARIAERGRRLECLEKLLGLYEPGCLQGGADFYRVLNAVPALFALDPKVLAQYRTYRELAVQRDTNQRRRAYEALILRIAEACGQPLTEKDVSAAFAEQWSASR